MPSLLHSSETESLVGIQFAIFSDKDIVQRSMVEVTTPSTQEGKIGGLADPRMGVLENGKLCRSCGLNNHGCPGHFGHHHLARPVYQIQFFKMIQKILRCVCVKCAKLLINKETAKGMRRSKGENRWKSVLAACQDVTRCGEQTEDGCGARQPHRYHEEELCRIVAEWKGLPPSEVAPQSNSASSTAVVTATAALEAGASTRRFLEPEYVYRLLRRISDEDVDFMGFSRLWCRPDWMMSTVLAIPPPQVRPSVLQDNNQRSEDDLTQKLIDIIKANITLSEKIAKKATKRAIDEWTMVLQYHIATLVNNDIPGVAQSAQRSGRPLKSLQQRLGSKEGRIRNNLQGKRVEFSARSVITPDPNISVAELGVPTKIAMNLTFPERVTAFNIDRLYALVQNGPDVYPGAKSIQRLDGRSIGLKHVNTKKQVLYEGDIVHRHLLDGDPVLFNRQPSLHRMSMMCHRVRVLEGSTFRLNVSVTKPYNADFDGDEMNMHVPQSVEAAIELREIAAVPKQLISPRLSKPLVSVVQDTLVGVNRLTRPTEFFNRRDFMNLLMHSKRWDGRMPPPAKRDPVPLWSGQQVVSALLPAVFLKAGNKKWKDEMGRDDQNYVVINGGKIEQGIMDGDTFDKGLIHILYNDFSPEATVDFLDGLQAVVATYLQNSGFSVGLSDIVADTETLTTISTDMETLKKRIEALQLQVHMGLFENTSGRSNQEEFEGKVFQTLDKMVELAGTTGLKSLSSNNRMVNMIACGSKGSNVNIAQMIATLGQQSIEGKRIGYGFQDRTLPHFKRYDDGAEARGFIESSFVKGLSPAEFYFHAMTGREGLIDTAVKSVTGETPIIVMENGITQRVPIGDWIDAQLAASESEVEHFEERDMELLQLKTPVYIPTTDADGHVSWGEITAITRHDPGKELYEIKTLAGKSVIVTESKSLLIYNDEKKQFERMSTPDVRPGHYVPTTMQLPTPPSILSEVEMKKYLPKNEYLYGSDFIKARSEMEQAMDGRERIPCGWWEEHNGKTFTLPYTDKAKLQRAIVRSDISNIKEGFVYPFTSNREHSAIPDVFALTHENGLFLGLFLAEGNVDIRSGYVQITNNNEKIQEFITIWFDKHGIKSGSHQKINNIGGTTSDIRGYSTVLAQFLTSFVGHGAANKRIPAELFAAPEDFITGLLSGYFSGDGTISENSVEAGSASALLIEGISMLCTRLGIFGKVFTTQLKSNNIGTETIAPTHRIAIRAQWAARFAERITMIDNVKEDNLRIIRASEAHRNFPYQNDVILDCITEINIVGVEKYPKVYDLTVPSTLNFGLANGLHVVDTADSGYMQRQLVKAMEDLMVFHDGSVRDAGGLIVQFSYGDDGTSATKIENQPIGLGGMSDTDIRDKFSVNDAPADLAQAHLSALFEDRDILVRNVWGGRVDKSVQSAVHLPRLIANAVQQLGLSPSTEGKERVNGAHVLETIQRIIQQTNSNNRLWAALLRYHLNPRGLQALGFTRAAFDWLAEQIVVKHMRSWVVPGEMSGIIAAQSLGEPTTQMCSTKETWVCVQNSKNASLNFTGQVGVFVDKLMSRYSDKIINLGGDKEVLDLPPEWLIMGVSNDEKTSWKPISQVSRHPANGGLVRVTTKSGRQTTATLSHSFLKRTTTGIAEIKGSDLELGLRIPVSFKQPESPKALTMIGPYTLTKDFGWLVGIYLADGCFNANTVRISKVHPIVEERIRALAAIYGWPVTVRHSSGAYGPSKDTIITSSALVETLMRICGTGSFEKFIGCEILHANRKFIAGVLSGYFDGDGNINVPRQQIRIGSRSRDLIRGIARLLPICGIFGTLCEETSIRIPDKVMYTLNIIRKHAKQFQTEIGLHLEEKAIALTEIVAYNEREAFSLREDIDMIPELGAVIAETGRLLQFPDQSRTYGRYAKKAAIGRRTLEKYIGEFNKKFAEVGDKAENSKEIQRNIDILTSAATSDVIWDEIVALDRLEDPHELVYDFTVPGNDSFMVDDNIFVHNTLNTFHLSGVAAKSGMTRGVPRLKELLKVTPNIRASSLTIYLREDLRTSKEAARRLAQELEFTMLKDLVNVSRIYFDPRDADTLIAEDKEWLSFFADFEQSETTNAGAKSPWILRLELDREKMFNKNITMEDVHFVIRKYNGEIDVTYSDHNASRLIFRVRITSTEKELDDLATVKQMQTKLLTSVLVRGLPGLKTVTFRKVRDESYQKNPENDNKYEPVEQYVLDTLGSNFLDVMIHPNVDGLKLISNHVHDIYENLGIEAARQILFKEIFTLFEQAAPVNYRHVALLCDAICNRGRMMSADRNGVNKKKNGPLAKASFEQTGEIMLKAAIFGEMDPVTGVSANIMTGQPIRGGTSFTQMLLDEAAMMEYISSAPPPKRTIERAPTLVQKEIDRLLDAEDAAPGCRQQDLRIPAALPSGPILSGPEELPDMEITLIDDEE